MAFGIKVNVFNPALKEYEWLWMHQSGAKLGEFYQWPTEREAEVMKRMCYPLSTNDWVKVCEV